MEIQNRHFPMMAGFESGDYFNVENIQLWEEFHKLSKSKQEILNSKSVANIIFNIERRYYLSEDKTENFSVFVRQYFFGELLKNDFLQKIANICNISTNEAEILLHKIVSVKINNEVEDVGVEGHISNQNTNNIKQKKIIKRNLDKNKFNVILGKYPKILEQEISENKITNPKTGEQLQPTVKNWIRVYEIEFGAGKHTIMGRGNFVFQSKTTRGLSEVEKQRLTQLLKAKDENIEIAVDINKNEIVFDSESVGNNNEIDNNTRQTQESTTTHQMQDFNQDVNSKNKQQTQKLNAGQIENENFSVQNNNVVNQYENNYIERVDNLKNKLADSQRQLEELERDISSSQSDDTSQVEQQVNTQQTDFQKPAINQGIKKESEQVASQKITPITKNAQGDRQNSFQQVPQIDLEKEILKNRAEMNNQPAVTEFEKTDDNYINIQSNLLTSQEVIEDKNIKKGSKCLIKTNKTQKPNKYIKQEALNNVEQVQNDVNNVAGSITFTSNHKMPGEK